MSVAQRIESRAISRSRRRLLLAPTWVPAAAFASAFGIWILVPRPLSLVMLAVPALIIGVSSLRAIIDTLTALVVLEIPLQIDIYLGHSPQEEALGSISGFAISLGGIALVTLFGLRWLTESVASGTPTRTVPALALGSAAAYTALVALSSTWALQPRFALYEAVIVLEALLLVTYLSLFVRTRREIVIVLSAIAVSILLQAAITIAIFVGIELQPVGPVEFAADGLRSAGTLTSPNKLGGYMALTLPVMLGWTVGGEAKFHRLLGAAGALAAVWCLVASGSRGAWVGAVVGVVSASAIAGARTIVRWRTIVKGAVAATVVAIPLAGFIASRVSAFDNPAARSRVPLMELAYDMIEHSPILGQGANNFAAALGQVLTVDDSATWLATVHNKYLLVLAETGIVGLAAFVLFLFAIMRTCWVLARGENAFDTALGIGLFGAVLATMVHMFVDVFHDRVAILPLFLIAGIALSRRSPPIEGLSVAVMGDTVRARGGNG